MAMMDIAHGPHCARYFNRSGARATENPFIPVTAFNNQFPRRRKTTSS
jgi:hypothetical protein